MTVATTTRSEPTNSRAKALDGCSSYYNPSQGVFATAQNSGGQVLPIIQIDAPNPSATESGPVDGAFVISRSGSTSSPVTVSFSIGGTAINGTDYESISDSILIPQDSTSAWITIRPIPDNLVEGNETVTLTLSPSDTYSVGSPSSATVTIQDATTNSPPTISILRQVNGSMLLTFDANAGRRYAIQGSTDLLNWTTIGSGLAGAGGSLGFLDSQTQTNRYRFYRVQWQ